MKDVANSSHELGFLKKTPDNSLVIIIIMWKYYQQKIHPFMMNIIFKKITKYNKV